MPTNAYKVKALSRLRLVALDSSGRIPVSGAVVFDSTSSIQSIAFSQQLDETGAESTTSIDGVTCIDTPPTYANSGKQVTLLGCGVNRELEAAFGWLRQASVSNGGWDEIDNATQPMTLLEMTFKVPSSSLIISSMHVVTSWRPDTGAQTVNGSDTQHMNWVGDTIKIPAALFSLFPTAHTPSGEFAHWNNFWQKAPTAYAGDAWAKWTDAVAAPTYPAGSPSTTPRAVTTA